MQLYLACYEHLPLQLSRSSCQPLPLQQLLALADGELQQQWQQLELGYPPNIGSLQLRQVRLADAAAGVARGGLGGCVCYACCTVQCLCGAGVDCNVHVGSCSCWAWLMLKCSSSGSNLN